jgi:PGF-pre-PGF domain-containing protein
MISEINFTGLSSKKISILSILAIFILGFSSMGASASTEVTGCMDITSPGVYNLTEGGFDVSDTSQNACINITSSNVMFDGLNNSIDAEGSDLTIIRIDNSTSTLSNATVEKITLFNGTGGATGIYSNAVDNSTFKDINFSDIDYGIDLRDVENGSINNSDFIGVRTIPVNVGFNGADNFNISNNNVEDGYGTLTSTAFKLSGPDLEVRNSSIVDTNAEILIQGDGVELRNISAGSSSELLVDPNVKTQVTKSDFGGINITVTLYSANFKTNNSASASDPLRDIGKFLELSNKTSDSYAQINVSYEESSYPTIDEEGLDIYEKEGGSFQELDSTFKGVNVSENEVYANITSSDISSTNDLDYQGPFGPIDNKYNIEGCQVIDYSGILNVESDVIDSDSKPCLKVTSSDVRINGQSHLLEGNRTSNALNYAGVLADSGVENLTVMNMSVEGWRDGILATSAPSSSEITVRDVSSKDNYHGILAEFGSTLEVIGGNYSANSNDGIEVGGDGDIEDIVANDNGGFGVILDANSDYNLTVANSSFKRNSFDGIRTQGNDAGDNFNVNLTNNLIYKNDDSGVYLEEANSSHIIGNNITDNNEESNAGDAGIRVNNSESVKIRDNDIEDNTKYGVRLKYLNNSVIKDNDIVGTAGNYDVGALVVGALSSTNSKGNEIINNTIFNNTGHGVDLQVENDTLIENNITSNSYNGVRASDVGLNISDNTIDDNGNSGILLFSSNAEIIDNDITAHDGEYGVRIRGANNSILQGNKIEDNSQGIHVESFEYSNNNTIEDGSLQSNDVAITVDDSSGKNTNNTFENLSLKNSGEFIDYESNELSNDFNDFELFIGVNVTFDGKNININKTASPVSSLPGQNFSIGSYFNVTNVSQGSETAWVDFNVTYDQSLVAGLNESTLAIQHYNGSGWTGITDAGVNTSKNLVYGNATRFSQFTIFGEGEPAISTDKNELDFGTVDSDNSVTKTVNVSNIGNINLTLREVKITNADDSGEYSITSGNLGSDASDDTNVTPSGYYEIDVQFDPGTDDSTNNADLEIYSNDLDTNPKTVNLTGIGEDVSSNDDSPSGGPSGPSGDSNDNPKKTQTFFDPVSGKPSEVDVDDEDVGVDRVTVYPASDLSSLKVTVEGLSGQPDDVSNPSGEAVDRYMDISTDASEDDISNATIDFTVEDQWIDDNDVDPSSIRLERYHDDSWNQLETEEVGQTDSGREFEAVTDGFSYFAVAADQESNDSGGQGSDDSQMNETDDSTGANESTNETQSDEKEDQAGSLVEGLLLPGVALLFILISGAVAYLKREELSDLISNDRSSEDEEISFN